MLKKIFHPIMPHKLYSNILISLVVAIAATIFILSSFLYMTFENVGLRIINTFIKDGLKQISYSTTFMCDLAKSLSLQIYFNKNITELTYYYPPDIREKSIAVEQLRSYSNTSPSIHSIYVYTSIRDTIYTSMPNLEEVNLNKKDSFFDKDIFKILNEVKSYKRLIPIPRIIPNAYPELSNKPDSNVYTFLFCESSVNSDIKDDSIILLNISENWLRKTIKNLDTEPSSNTFIINRKGKMVISDKKNSILTDLSGEPYIKSILSSKSSSNYFVSNVGDTKSLVTYISSASLDWIFIRVTPYSSIMERINNMRKKTFLIGFFILFGGLLCSLVISHRLYTPIKNVVSKLTSLQTENLNIKKQNALKCILLDSKDREIEDIQKTLTDLSIEFNLKEKFFILLLKVDHFKDFCSKHNVNEQHLIKFAIMNIACEIFSSIFFCESVDTADDHIVILCNIPANIPADDLPGKITGFIKDIQENVSKYYKISLSATVSSILDTFNKVSYLYYKTLNTSNYRLIFGHNCLLFSDNIKESIDREYIYPAEKGKQLVDSLMLGKTNTAKELYLQIITSSLDFSYNIVKSTLLRLAVDINVCIDIVQRSNGNPMPYNLNTFISELNNMETLEEINVHFFSLFDVIVPKLEEKTISKHDAIISNVIEIIHLHYMNQNLSIDMIADMVHASPTYLGRLFRKIKSRSISDYINDVRIEAAKNLLLSTDYSISEIVEQIGCINRGYFYQLFKKTCAVTPNQYRQKNQCTTVKTAPFDD